MTEQQVMEQVRRDFGPAIATARTGTSVSAAFMAALVVNESSGSAEERLAANRFEKGVLRKIVLAALGIETFSDPSLSRPIAQQEWLLEADYAIDRRRPGNCSFMLAGLQNFKELATSWGPMQLMGWHAREWGVGLVEFRCREKHFQHACVLILHFAQKYKLRADRDFRNLFRCWNTGRPRGRTYDPNYVTNGLRRLKLYQQLEQAA